MDSPPPRNGRRFCLWPRGKKLFEQMVAEPWATNAAGRARRFCFVRMSSMSARLPDWIREKKVNLRDLHEVKSLLREKSLHSVCESLACPNRSECFSRGTVHRQLRIRFLRICDFRDHVRFILRICIPLHAQS